MVRKSEEILFKCKIDDGVGAGGGGGDTSVCGHTGTCQLSGSTFFPKIFLTGCKFEFELSAGSKKYFKPGRKLGFGHELLRKNSFEQGDFFIYQQIFLKYCLKLEQTHTGETSLPLK